MKKNILLITATLFLAAGCSKDSPGAADISGPEEPAARVDFGTFAVEDDVKILIFKEASPDYKHIETFSPTWVNKKSSKTMTLGRYSFAFYKTMNVESPMGTLDGNSTLADVKFNAKPDAAAGVGFYKSVDDMFLSDYISNLQTFNIYGGTPVVVSRTLKRVVSGIELQIRRGKKNASGGFDEVQFPPGTENITNWIKSATVTADNLSTQMGLNGPLDDAAKIKHKFVTASGTIDPTSFGSSVLMEGPLVFPGKSKAKSNINITLEPVNSTEFPTPLTKTVQNLPEAGKKMRITLWLTKEPVQDQSISIEVEYLPLSPDTGGDKGIWE